MSLEAVRAVVFGHAVADALGVPVEFASREELDEDPVTGMEGGGTYGLPAGCWSDDTSMSLATLNSLASGRLDYEDVMRGFCKWYYDGAYTPMGEVFDVGCTCANAIEKFFEGKMPVWACGETGERSNGNGSLMRIYPFVLFGEYADCKEDFIEMIHLASSLTHAHRRSLVGCGIYGFVLRGLLKNPCKKAVFDALDAADRYYAAEEERSAYSRIFSEDFPCLAPSEIQSSGYVVHTLEAALWCLLTTDSYAECVLKAVNLGDDSDTVAAVAGALAGALYGLDEIPSEWRNALKKREEIDDLCQRAYQSWCAKPF